MSLGEKCNIDDLQSKLKEFLGGTEVSVMLENRKEKYVDLRVSFETLQDAVMCIV